MVRRSRLEKGFNRLAPAAVRHWTEWAAGAAHQVAYAHLATAPVAIYAILSHIPPPGAVHMQGGLQHAAPRRRRRLPSVSRPTPSIGCPSSPIKARREALGMAATCMREPLVKEETGTDIRPGGITHGDIFLSRGWRSSSALRAARPERRESKIGRECHRIDRCGEG